MSDDKDQFKDQLTDHEYDGIQEYNNPLPVWWVWTFWATIIFGFMYYIHYETGAGPSLKQELDSAMKVIAENQQKHGATPLISGKDLEDKLKSSNLAVANNNFQGKCAMCHGAELQGGIGPNLTDAFWLHGKGQPEDILKLVKEGVVDKGMPAWGSLLKDDEIVDLAALIISKQDSSPAGAKEPQGEKVR